MNRRDDLLLALGRQRAYLDAASDALDQAADPAAAWIGQQALLRAREEAVVIELCATDAPPRRTLQVV